MHSFFTLHTDKKGTLFKLLWGLGGGELVTLQDLVHKVCKFHTTRRVSFSTVHVENRQRTAVMVFMDSSIMNQLPPLAFECCICLHPDSQETTKGQITLIPDDLKSAVTANYQLLQLIQSPQGAPTHFHSRTVGYDGIKKSSWVEKA